MNAVERQTLLSDATPRPWHVSTGVECNVEDCPSFVAETGAYSSNAADNALTVAAVNEYEALLACESGLRALVGFLRPDNAHARHARAALEALDDIRRNA